MSYHMSVTYKLKHMRWRVSQDLHIVADRMPFRQRRAYEKKIDADNGILKLVLESVINEMASPL